MRKLADRAGMRLSNVQYYFKSRDDVLKAMVALYFKDCTESVIDATKTCDAYSTRDRLYFLIRLALNHGETLSDMCRTFRELWAISNRNPAVHECLMAYYRDFADMLVDFVADQRLRPSTRDRLKCLLTPFIEGYSITAPSLPLTADEVARMMTDVAMRIIDDEPR